MLSLAVAESVTVPVILAPGLVNETIGAVVSGMMLVTVPVTAVEVVLFPAASYAFAVSEYEPFVNWVVSHDKLNDVGPVVSVPSNVDPW
jgi:hypothetical protein